MKIQWKVLVVCLIIVYAFAFLGSLFTETGDWYESVKPTTTPPNWIFPVVWNILFFLIALSLYFIWLKAENKGMIILIYGINLILNFLWSIIFFWMKNPKIAFFELIILWVSIVSMLIFGLKTDKKTFYLIIPYLLWVSFAGILNYMIAF